MEIRKNSNSVFDTISLFFIVFAGSGRNAHQNLGDDLSSNIIIGATPSHWNNDGRGKIQKKNMQYMWFQLTWILRLFFDHKYLDAIKVCIDVNKPKSIEFVGISYQKEFNM